MPSRYIIILLFELGFGIKFNIIGQISISELFLFVYVPFILSKVKWKKAVELRKITIAYVVLFFFQVLSEYMVGNDLQSVLKGLAVTIVSYFHFMFLTYYLSKQKSLILAIVFSQVIMKLAFGTTFEDQSFETIVGGGAATYLKFYIAPLVILIFLSISIIYNRKSFVIVFFVLGTLLVVLGARSAGSMVMLTGIVAYMIERKMFIGNRKKIFFSLGIIGVLGYAFYALYISKVLSGDITSGNSWQVLQLKNPYNPLELLVFGRKEVWVGWQAFMDKFWFGHGAWPYDATGHYQRLMFALTDDLSSLTKERISYHFLIPSHSVLIGVGMMYGIFAFLSILYILIYFFKRGFFCFVHCERRYLLVLIYFLIDSCWTALLSPFSHFRLSLPLTFAIIFVLYSTAQRKIAIRKRRMQVCTLREK